VGSLRSRIVAWIGRRYLARQKDGFDLSKLSMLPEHVLLPLRREGLDPVSELGHKRRAEPISRMKLPLGVTAWLVTGYDEAKAVLGKVDGFSNDFTNLMGKFGASAEQNPGGLGFADPPVHTRLRRVLTPEFTMRRLARLTPRIEAIIDGQLDAMAEVDGPVDLWRMFALPIPSLTICELLGVAYEDRDDFQRLSTARFDLFGGANASLGAITESLSYLSEVVRKQRESPGDGLLGMLIKEHGHQIDDRELAGLADGLLTGGLETTASMLALGALVLLHNPESAEQVTGDADAVNRFVEELLRYLTVVQVAFPRFATQDMEIAGVRIAKGDIVVVSLSGADRDEKLGADMERFDPRRDPTSHLAFGYGIHRCIGAELARMELRAAYPALVRRFPRLRLAITDSEVSFRSTSIVYGVDSLPVLLN
jgi:cytochrome P450